MNERKKMRERERTNEKEMERQRKSKGLSKIHRELPRAAAILKLTTE